jgi:hypothetical protein
MLVDNLAFKRLHQWVQWKDVLVFTVVVLAFRLVFIDDLTEAFTDFSIGSSYQKNLMQNTSSQTQLYADMVPPPPAVAAFENVWPGSEKVRQIPYDGLHTGEYVAVCMTIKDQSRDLTEFFVHHYYHHNIKRFYIMDDGSDPPLSSFEYPGVPRAALTFTFESRETRSQHMQMQFYAWCVERYGRAHKWIAYLDGDEFIETPGPETLQEVLQSFEFNNTVGALGIKYVVFSHRCMNCSQGVSFLATPIMQECILD